MYLIFSYSRLWGWIWSLGGLGIGTWSIFTNISLFCLIIAFRASAVSVFVSIIAVSSPRSWWWVWRVGSGIWSSSMTSTFSVILNLDLESEYLLCLLGDLPLGQSLALKIYILNYQCPPLPHLKHLSSSEGPVLRPLRLSTTSTFNFWPLYVIPLVSFNAS